MAQKKRSDQSPPGGKPRQKLHRAALHLAARDGWTDLTQAEIYAAAGQSLPPDTLVSVWPLAEEILASLDRAVMDDVANRLGDLWRDNLFELLMTRFDQMQAHRAAYTDLMPAALHSPCRSAALARRLPATIDAMLDAAHVPVDRLRRPAAVAALTVLYLSLVETWRQDDSADLAKTMAAVDKRIGWFEKILDALPGLNRQAHNHA